MNQRTTEIKKIMLDSTLALCTALLCLSVQAANNSGDACSLSYRPSKSILSGTLVEREYYGAPGFGDSPEVDKKEKVYLLALDGSVDIKGDKNNELESESFSGVDLIQLEFPIESIKMYKKFIGRRVVLKGVLDMASTGHQHTDVTLSSNDIKLASSEKQFVCRPIE